MTEIFSKIQNDYFHIGNPVTLVLSFASIQPMLSIPNAMEVLEHVKANLNSILDIIIKEEKNEHEIKKLKMGIQNLYAIIIDTCWYNWLPELAINRHRAAFPTGYNNVYACLYNSNHPLVKHGSQIYSNLPYQDIISIQVNHEL